MEIKVCRQKMLQKRRINILVDKKGKNIYFWSNFGDVVLENF